MLSSKEAYYFNYLANMHRHDPDVIVGHNFIDFDLDVLLHRMKATKVDHWSRIGRLRRTKWPKLQSGAGGTADSSYAERQMASGRLLCDTYRAAQVTTSVLDVTVYLWPCLRILYAQKALVLPIWRPLN